MPGFSHFEDFFTDSTNRIKKQLELSILLADILLWLTCCWMQFNFIGYIFKKASCLSILKKTFKLYVLFLLSWLAFFLYSAKFAHYPSVSLVQVCLIEPMLWSKCDLDVPLCAKLCCPSCPWHLARHPSPTGSGRSRCDLPEQQAWEGSWRRHRWQ